MFGEFVVNFIYCSICGISILLIVFGGIAAHFSGVLNPSSTAEFIGVTLSSGGATAFIIIGIVLCCCNPAGLIELVIEE